MNRVLFGRLNRLLVLAGWFWIFYTLGTTFILAVDVRSNPELWHFIPEGFDPVEEDEVVAAAVVDNPDWLEGLDLDATLFNASGLSVDEFDGDGRLYLDYVYEVNNLKTYEHVSGWMKPLGLWVFITFILMRANLELAEQRIKQLKRQVKK
ncbi:hypothetical protein IID20_03185 [Patescibacteria group bacterium]|nr:hypothetical protein [Patescibacteria group bacterium]